MIAALVLALGLAAGPVEPAPAQPDPASRFSAANTAYRAGDFATAAAGYEALLAEGLESPALHLNLGNARLRRGERGRAAASYERALRLDPQDGDARTNLELARHEAAERIAGAVPRPVFLRLADRTPDAAGAWGLAALWVAGWALLAAAGRAGRPSRGRRIAGGALALLAAVALGGLLAAKAADRETPSAVVIREGAPLRPGPEAALLPVDALPEATPVRVLGLSGDAVQVRLENGLEGWVAAADLEPL